MGAGAIDVTGIDGGNVKLSRDAVDRLARSIDAPLLRPGEGGYDEAILIWNGMVASSPALVAQPATADEVAAAVAFARDEGVLLTIKCGGHNIAGTAVADGALTLDLSRMRGVSVDANARLVHAAGGCLVGDVDRATQEHGLATPLGFVSQTGLSGLTLGGGFGYLTRRFGLAVDNLTEAEIVTADGRIRTVNAKEDPDLFWALRGGGGNFGVVTRFTFRIHEVEPNVTGGLILWGAERGDDVIGMFRDLTATAPRDLTVAMTQRLAPAAPFIPEEWHGKPVFGLILCYTGSDPETVLAPVRAIGDPIIDMVVPKTYVEQQSMLDPMEPKGPRRYWKTEFFPAASDGFLATWRRAGEGTPSMLSQEILFHLGGALAETDLSETPFAAREAQFVGGHAGVWLPDADADADRVVGWVREGWQTLRTESIGSNYINFQVAEDDEDRLAEAYGKHMEPLQRIKAAVDPDNLFRANRNISPAR